MRKVTPEIKQVMKQLREKGITFAGIGKILGLSANTIQYHTSEKEKQNTINRALRNPKEWIGRKEYNKKYQSERYNNDTEFRERVQTANRENWRKKHGKSNNLS